ncbi:ATP synthase subunit I [Fuchsiella alkaliacetigena]|uniref:ATP synthase subunit I n=1 Tax=Fuchsiella alkaliacetigena TaxID=957042 RepID=UPI002009DE66|nr:ATP synthase subunit I [Fuchsiella alkaliacetigena]MCK8824587.1 ATP synthase subunit I [Fuchsiella alkaliacetigena]
MNEKLKKTEAEIRNRILKIGGILTLLLIFSLQIDWVLGFVLGTIISLLMFRLLALTINESIKKSTTGAGSFMVRRYFIRYSIYGVIIYLALTNNQLDFIATVIGLLMVKITIIVSEIYTKFRDYLNNLVENNH